MNVLVYLLFLILLSCSEEPIQQLQSREGLPDQESWGVNIILTDQGIVRAKVQSGHLEKYNEKEFIMLDSSVYVDFYDKNEIHTSVLTSDVAEINQNSNDMIARSNVVAKSDSGITLYSKTLLWSSRDEKLKTQEKIMITTLDRDTLYGIGFESDSDLKNWKILSPSGVTSRVLN